MQTFDHLQKKEQRFLTIYDYILNIIAMVSIFSTLYLGAIQIQSQTLDVVYLTSIVLMVLTLFEQAVPMSNVAYYKADTDQSLYDINEVIQYDDIKKVKNSHVNDESAPLFELNNVTFKYENQETPVLNRISFNVYQGERIAIIGPSGSGKSTLLQVMLGLYQVQEGSVIYNQSDIFRIEDESKYSDINALLQSQQLFDGTIKDNLLTDCNEDKIQHILNSLDLSHLSLEEYITMDGETLSGGEIQRLSIARLLLKTKAKIWMLDEPTTGLDIEHTVQMMHLLLKQVETMIVSTHDLRLLPDFDRIIVMIDGEIKEQGSYETLIQNRGYLYQMEQLNQ